MIWSVHCCLIGNKVSGRWIVATHSEVRPGVRDRAWQLEELLCNQCPPHPDLLPLISSCLMDRSPDPGAGSTENTDNLESAAHIDESSYIILPKWNATKQNIRHNSRPWKKFKENGSEKQKNKQFLNCAGYTTHGAAKVFRQARQTVAFFLHWYPPYCLRVLHTGTLMLKYTQL